MTGRFEPAADDFAARVRVSFARQQVMSFIGARLSRVEPGRTRTICELAVVAMKNGRPTACAHGLQTLMCMHGRPDHHFPSPLAGEGGTRVAGG